MVQAWEEDTPDPNYQYMVGKMKGAHFARQVASAQYGEDGIEMERMFDEGWELTPAVVSKQFDEHYWGFLLPFLYQTVQGEELLILYAG
ncbi:hypothetical protein MMC22_001443 [Lobaria immixta]|nr:hypothetical protein [Lobaria immixta]